MHTDQQVALTTLFAGTAIPSGPTILGRRAVTTIPPRIIARTVLVICRVSSYHDLANIALVLRHVALVAVKL